MQKHFSEEKKRVINFENYSLSVGYSSLLNNISFSVTEGDSIAIIGPVSSGKSLLLSIMALFILKPSSPTFENKYKQEGKFEILDLVVSDQKLALSEINRISSLVKLVSEQSTWLPISIAENFLISETLQNHSDSFSFEMMIEKLAISQSNKTQLKSLADLLPNQVEPPFLQQLAIIRALQKKPKILLLDDAFLRMDPVLLKQTENLIFSFSDKLTTIWATNDLYQASRVTDWILFMRSGTAVEYTPTAQFFTNPSTHSAEEFISGRE